MLVIWIVLVLFFFKNRNTMLGGAGGAIGIFFGLTLITDTLWLGFILIILNLYVLYVAIMGEGRKK